MDRLAEIAARFAVRGNYRDVVSATDTADIEWLIAEVRRLRAALEHMVDVYGSLADLGAGRPALDQARRALGRPPQ